MKLTKNEKEEMEYSLRRNEGALKQYQEILEMAESFDDEVLAEQVRGKIEILNREIEHVQEVLRSCQDETEVEKAVEVTAEDSTFRSASEHFQDGQFHECAKMVANYVMDRLDPGWDDDSRSSNMGACMATALAVVFRTYASRR